MLTAPPRISLNPMRQVVRPGDDAYTVCSAEGDQPITIEWSGINREIPSSASVNGGLLQFRSISVHDTGRYLCKAVNHAGEAESIAEVIVMGECAVPQPDHSRHFPPIRIALSFG